MKRLAWAVLVLLLFFAYYLSSIPGLKVLPVFRQINSGLHVLGMSLTEVAGKIAARLPEQFGPAKTAASQFYQYALNNPEIMEYLVRKAGHVFMFFLITVAFFSVLRQYMRSPWGALFVAALLGTVMAALDEFYQTFVIDRSGSIYDVVVDMTGVAVAVFFIVFALLVTGRHRAAPHNAGSAQKK